MAQSRWTYRSQRISSSALGARSRQYRPPQRVYFFTKRTAIWVLIIALGYVVVFSPLFRIRTITVQGNSAISAAVIIDAVQAVAQGYRWYVFSEQHLLFFSAADLNRRLVENQRIESVQVRRHFFGTLVVTVKERTTAALWRGHDRWFEIDANGRVLSEVPQPAATETRLVLMNSATLDDPSVGGVAVSADAITLARHISDNLSPPIGLKIATYDVAKFAQGTMTAVTEKGLQIYFNVAQDPGAQVNKLRSFVTEKDRSTATWQHGLHYIDLRFGDTRVYYK